MGAFLIIQGIGLGKLGNFYNIKSILIVVGGTLAATAVSYPLSILIDILKHIVVLFHRRQYNIPRLVDQLVDLVMIAGQSSLPALEGKAEEIKNPFFKQSILMTVDTNDPDKVRLILERELENIIARHDAATGLYEEASAYAPIFGTVGTPVGLTSMLKGLNLGGSGGVSSLGGDMSIALVTTSCGSVLSSPVFHPIVRKLCIHQDEEELYYSTITEGIITIQSGENPKYLREHLLASPKQSQQEKLLSKAAKNILEGGEGN